MVTPKSSPVFLRRSRSYKKVAGGLIDSYSSARTVTAFRAALFHNKKKRAATRHGGLRERGDVFTFSVFVDKLLNINVINHIRFKGAN